MAEEGTAGDNRIMNLTVCVFFVCVQKIMEKKMATPIDLLCKGFPDEFRVYFEYCRALRFADKPDYSYLRRLFKDLALRNEIEYDGNFDWRMPVDPVAVTAAAPAAGADPAAGAGGGV